MFKCTAISDTHCQGRNLDLGSGDFLFHAGDLSTMGSLVQLKSEIEWLAAQDFKHIVFIAGNHDWLFETDSGLAKTLIPKHIHYLEDSYVELEGYKIWGSPYSLFFQKWAFNKHRGPDIKRHWDWIPDDTEILLVHGPAYGYGDIVKGYWDDGGGKSPWILKWVPDKRVGCHDLLDRVKQIKPLYLISGHIHVDHGVIEKDGTTFVNAAVVDKNQRICNEPYVFWLDTK